MDVEQANRALISDLQWQIDQIAARGIKNAAGAPFVPALYKRNVERAVEAGGDAVVEHVRTALRKAPSQSFKRFQAAGSLDLACEALAADGDRPYAHLFSDEDRALARERLGPHLEEIEQRNAERRERMAAARAKLRDEGIPRRHELDAQLRRRRVTR